MFPNEPRNYVKPFLSCTIKICSVEG